MKIHKIFLGAWIPRTNLHLKELYAFFAHNHVSSRLNSHKSQSLQAHFKNDKVEMGEMDNGLKYLIIHSNSILTKITEEGVIFISSESQNFQKDLKVLEDYYSNFLGPSLSYLFSRGAPLPKELSKLQSVHPVVVIAEDAQEKDFIDIADITNDVIIEKFSSSQFDIFTGNTFILINVKNSNEDKNIIDRLVNNLVFIREFESQLGNYLENHREMWNKISAIRESKKLRVKDFPEVRAKILDFLKTLSFTKARLRQMSDIVITKQALLDDADISMLQKLKLNRFEHLNSEQKYVYDLCEMTIEYTQGTLSLLELLYQQSTQADLNALKIITFIAAITGFFGMNIAFPWDEKWNEIFPSSLMVVIFIIITVSLTFVLLKILVNRRQFIVKNKEIIKK